MAERVIVRLMVGKVLGKGVINSKGTIFLKV